MKKFNTGLLLASTILFASCSAKKMITKTVETTVIDTEFNPQIQSSQISEGLTLTIEPIDAKKLDFELSMKSTLSGSYSNSKSYLKNEYFEFPQRLSKQEVRLGKNLERIYASIDELVYKGELEEVQGEVFKEMVYLHFTKSQQIGFLGYEESISPDYTLGVHNPFKVNTNYLSVYKLTFNNESNEVKDVSINDFQIVSENELLYPYKIEYFKSLYQETKNEEKLRTVYRINMPDQMRLAPNQKEVVTYFASPPINLNNQKLIVNYLGKNQTEKFEYHVKSERHVISNKYDRYSLTSTLNYLPAFHIFKNHEVHFPIKDKEVFLSSSSLNHNSKIYSVFVDIVKGKLFFSKTDLNKVDRAKREIKLNKVK